MIKVDGLLGGTQARRLSEAEERARRFVADATGSGYTDVDVAMTYDVARAPDAHLAREWRGKARVADEIATRLARDAARAMASEEGLPLRDVAFLLGISGSRVSGLLTPRAPRAVETPPVRGAVL